MLITIVAGIFVLGVVVLVHEFGHFIVAKWSGVFVKTFSIGFGKKLIKRRKGETEYTISVLPFGGYVKFAGESEYYDEVDREALDEEQRSDSDEIPDSEIPRERYFTSKPPAVRAAVLFAGPFMNYVLAVVLYIGVLWVLGDQVYPTTTIGEVVAGSAADSVGITAGDRIVTIDGIEVANWGEVLTSLRKDEGGVRRIVLERDGLDVEVACAAREEDGNYLYGVAPHVPPRIGRVKRDNPAYRAGIREGALIESINDTTVTTWDGMARIIFANPEVPLYVMWTQDGVAHADTIVPKAVKRNKPGTIDEFVVVGSVQMSPIMVRSRSSLPESVVEGFRSVNGTIVAIVGYLKLLVTRQVGVDTLGGPILITQMAGETAKWGIDQMLLFLAFLSINLCIFNLIPLLPFDGGHLALLAYEAVVRRPVNRRLRDIFAQAGFIVIILLMIFVIMLDINRCSGSSPGFF